MEAHERANAIYMGAWQETLRVRRPTSRQEVAHLFAGFAQRSALCRAEDEALKQYALVLQSSQTEFARVYQSIAISRVDIEVLYTDLQVRIDERIADDESRRTALWQRDQDLSRVIKGLEVSSDATIFDEHAGKRLELQEMYLLRRLIHAADTGHLVSIDHGMIREDLAQHRGSVDMRLMTPEGVFDLQVKTFKRDASYEARAQRDVKFVSTRDRLKDSHTHLVTLETKDVTLAYAAALRQSVDAPISLQDKYTALEPMLAALQLPAREYQSLLQQLGFTQEGFQREAAEYERRAAALHEYEAQIWAARQAEQRAQEALEAKHAAEVAARAEEERRREERGRTAHEEAVRRAQEEREERTRIAKERQRAAEERAQQSAEQAAAKRRAAEEAERRAREVAEKEAQREARKKEKGDWPPKNLVGASLPSILKAIGMLPHDWDGKNPAVLLQAKKDFFQLCLRPKKGEKYAADTDRPNDLFLQIFPTREAFEHPETARERFEQLMRQRRAA
jgi:chemotaxis protein histidine kinase CheA